MQHTSQPTNKNRPFDVEVLSTDDLWAKFGPKLPDPQSPSPSQVQRSWRRFGVYSAGAVFTLSLHTLLFGVMLLGTAGRPPIKPLTEGAAASGQNSDASEFVTTLLLLNDHSITPADQLPDESAYAVLKELEQQPKSAMVLASLDATKTPELSGSEAGTDDSSPTAEATGNEAGRAMLFGRYMGQIKARIERAWDYPTSPSPDKFDCKVQIKQNQRGEVQEVTLQRCGDDPVWKVSLIQAIQRASPLSAPPDDSVFTAVITMSFSAASNLQLAQVSATAINLTHDVSESVSSGNVASVATE